MASNDGNNRPKGPCCMGSLCQHPTGKLCASHKCVSCKKIVHILCGTTDAVTDELICGICSPMTTATKAVAKAPTAAPKRPARKLKKAVAIASQPPDPPPWVSCVMLPSLPENKPSQAGNISSQKSSTIKKCPACGGIDHLRRSSKKCKFYKSRSNTASAASGGTAVAGNTNDSSNNNNSTTTNTSITTDTATITTTTNNNSNNTVEPTNISKPVFINISKKKTTYTPVVDVSSDKFSPSPTTFRTYLKNYRDRVDSVPPTPSVLMDKYFNKTIITHLCDSSNAYVQARKESKPDLLLVEKEETLGTIYHLQCLPFLGIDILHGNMSAALQN